MGKKTNRCKFKSNKKEPTQIAERQIGVLLQISTNMCLSYKLNSKFLKTLFQSSKHLLSKLVMELLIDFIKDPTKSLVKVAWNFFI